MKTTDQSKPALVFVYNAESGLFNALTDTAHKILSPETYQCSLCALTHSSFGMRRGWKRFLETLGRPLEFLHADELEGRHGIAGVALPAVFIKEDGGLGLLVGADSIDACASADDLRRLIEDGLRERPPAADTPRDKES